jgi:ABC-type lipoprotein export system ATPase subunit
MGPAAPLGCGGDGDPGRRQLDRRPRIDRQGSAVTVTALSSQELSTGGSTEVMVELREVFCVHRTDEGDAAALQGTTLQVRRGELVCVLGPSGAGKSTLLRVIAGLQVPSAGVVSLLGSDIGRLGGRLRARLRREHLGFLGQHADRALPPELHVRDAVALPLALRGTAAAGQRRRALELLEAVGLDDRADALPAELSGGERQRVALCAALAHRPALLLADEPTGELDAAGAESMRRLIADLVREQGGTAIVVTHDPAASTLADRTVRLRDGRVVADHGAGSDGVVVGGGGWLQLPPELLREARIGARAHLELTPQGVLVAPAGNDFRAVTGAPRAAPAHAPTGEPWTPARIETRSLGRGRGRGASRRQVISALGHVFAAGRLTAVTGRSGAGKTTLLRLLAGLDRADRGEVLIDGESVGARDAEQLSALRRERIGYLPQEPSPIGFLSSAENVVLTLRLRGWSTAAAVERATVALARVGLSDRAAQRVARLSAGEAQRVALARAAASARGLLIVDEPTSRLDQASAATVAELLAAAAIDDRQTVICATHDGEVIRHAHEVIELGG